MSKKVLVWTDKCKGKSLVGFDKVECTNHLPKGQKLCDYHLLQKFELNRGTYDSEDTYGMQRLFTEEDVIAALRQATKL